MFQQKNYTENFIQCILDAALGKKKRGATLVVGGDGRYKNFFVSVSKFDSLISDCDSGITMKKLFNLSSRFVLPME